MNKTSNYDIVKFIDKEFELEVNVSPEEETIWLTQEQIVELFDRDRSVISKHIKKIFNDYECDEKSNVQKMHIGNCTNLKNYELEVKIYYVII